jgi:hypothetical protein
MPRIVRVARGGIVQHVLNRGDGRLRLFHKPADYDAFLDVPCEGGESGCRGVGCGRTARCRITGTWCCGRGPIDPGSGEATRGQR